MNTVVVNLKDTREKFINHEALNFYNKSIVERLAIEGKMSIDEAKVLFQDMLKFLVLASGIQKLSPAARIDLAWHNFILHTRDYEAFCQKYFGSFIHHEPGIGLIYLGKMLNVEETADFAKEIFGEVNENWTVSRGQTCGSGGC